MVGSKLELSRKRKREDILIDHILQVEQFAAELKIDKTVCERAEIIYKQLTDICGLRKGKQCAIQLACLYIAGRQLDRMKSMEELANRMKIKKGDIFKALKYIREKLPEATSARLDEVGDEDLGRVGSQPVKAQLAHLSQLLKICVDCQVVKCAEEMATQIAASSVVLQAKPATQAAALLWICSHLFLGCGEKAVDIDLLVHHARVGQPAIRRTYKSLLPHLPKLLPDYLLSGNWQGKLKLP